MTEDRRAVGRNERDEKLAVAPQRCNQLGLGRAAEGVGQQRRNAGFIIGCFRPDRQRRRARGHYRVLFVRTPGIADGGATPSC